MIKTVLLLLISLIFLGAVQPTDVGQIISNPIGSTVYLEVDRVGRGSADDPFRPSIADQDYSWVQVVERGLRVVVALSPRTTVTEYNKLNVDWAPTNLGTDITKIADAGDKRDPYNLPALPQRSGTDTETFDSATDWATGTDQTWAKIALSGASTETIVSQRGRIARNGVDGTRTVMYMSAFSSEDTDLYIDYANQTANGVRLGGALRVIPAGPTMYFCDADITGNDAFAYKVVGGVVTLIASSLNTVTATEPWSMRFDVTTEAGPVTRLQFRIWQQGTAEPGTWDFDFTDSDAALQEVAGNPGVEGLVEITNARAVDFDGVARTDNDGAAAAGRIVVIE